MKKADLLASSTLTEKDHGRHMPEPPPKPEPAYAVLTVDDSIVRGVGTAVPIKPATGPMTVAEARANPFSAREIQDTLTLEQMTEAHRYLERLLAGRFPSDDVATFDKWEQGVFLKHVAVGFAALNAILSDGALTVQT